MRKSKKQLKPTIHAQSDMSQNPEIKQIVASLPFSTNGYLFEEVIGTGSYGVVFKVYNQI